MDGFLTTILAGIIVALVGGIVAFYFGGVRERQKQRYEQQRDAQNRQEEREKALDERRIQALDATRTRVRSIGEEFMRWSESASHNLELPSLPDDEKGAEEALAAFSGQLQELREQGEKLRNEMSSLWDFYVIEKPYLEDYSRNIVETFTEEFERRHTPVLEALLSDPTAEAPSAPDWNDYTPSRSSIAKLWKESDWEQRLLFLPATPVVAVGLPIMRLLGIDKEDYENARHEHWGGVLLLVKPYVENVKQAAEHARAWDLQATFDAFDAEVKRVARARS
jgi:hypothetical protein